LGSFTLIEGYTPGDVDDGTAQADRRPMALWCVFGAKYNENYTTEIDGFLHRLDELFATDEGGKLNEGRSHGNPFLDVSSLIRQDSTAVMGGQMAAYDAEDRARAAGDEPPSGLGYREFFGVLPEIWDQNHGFHIIDIDDPELVQPGAAYIHARLTSYVAEPLREGSDSFGSLPPYIRTYVECNTLNALANGWYAGLPAVFLESLRQRLGFPYEWWGAPID
jgi:hypothetical protein